MCVCLFFVSKWKLFDTGMAVCFDSDQQKLFLISQSRQSGWQGLLRASWLWLGLMFTSSARSVENHCQTSHGGGTENCLEVSWNNLSCDLMHPLPLCTGTEQWAATPDFNHTALRSAPQVAALLAILQPHETALITLYWSTGAIQGNAVVALFTR